MKKKIAIIGTGANGSCVSADLISNGLDVKMIDQWPEHVEKMRKDGEELWNTFLLQYKLA